MTTNIIYHHALVTQKMRNEMNNHESFVLWFTGLSGSGKSTLAHAVEEKLHYKHYRTFVLDGDNIRHGLSYDLSFTKDDRKENIRRIGEVSKLMVEAGMIVLTAFISPCAEYRSMVRNMFPRNSFFEIYCQASIGECERRDVKGLYKKAREGEIKNYTGISSSYDVPQHPDLVVNTDIETVDESVKKILSSIDLLNKMEKK